jgi:hypothetical protein
MTRNTVPVPHAAGAAGSSEFAARLAETLTRHAGGMVEIALSPEELGRVRMSLHPSDSGITVNIATERPETHDLIRRHVEQLGAELRALGYGSVSFSFSGDGSAKPDRHPSAPGVATGSQTPDPAAPDTVPDSPRTVAAGLDMRM